LEGSFRKFSGATAYLRFDGDDKSNQVAQEIDLAVDARLDGIARSFPSEHRRKISERLKNMQHRTYLWLHLTFDIIEQSPSEYGRYADIESLLSYLPSQVSDAYEKILSRSKDSTKAKMLFQIVLAATHRLTLDEANIALTLASSKQRILTNAALELEMWPREPTDNFKSAVRNFCGLFINIYDSKLYLIHQTARDFLLDSKSQGKWKGRLNMPILPPLSFTAGSQFRVAYSV
jgi:ankyrin repeat domain-containing protein 50